MDPLTRFFVYAIMVLITVSLLVVIVAIIAGIARSISESGRSRQARWKPTHRRSLKTSAPPSARTARRSSPMPARVEDGLDVLGAQTAQPSLQMLAPRDPLSMWTEALAISARPSTKDGVRLREWWFDLRNRVRQAYSERTPTRPDVYTEATAAAVLAAWGECAAIDSACQDFAADRQIATRYESILHKMEQAMAPLNRIRERMSVVLAVARYQMGDHGFEDVLPRESIPVHSARDLLGLTEAMRPRTNHIPVPELIAMVRSLKQEYDKQSQVVQELHRMLEEERQQCEAKLSPGYLLLMVLRDGQAYSPVVRQGAAWGLHVLRTQGHLVKESQDEVFRSIQGAVTGPGAAKFCERSVLLHPEAKDADLHRALRDGLRWMGEIAEGDYSGSCNKRITISPWALKQTLGLLALWVPGFSAFLRSYPLHLMRLDHHHQLLGKMVRRGCDISLWTRYTPPDEVGPVHNRWLELDDRSVPNAMGIYFRLLEHPVLGIPVIYHEYLHYAGAGNVPGEGLANEAEVLVREILFTRVLLARLAPDHPEGAPAFERALVDCATLLGVQPLLSQLLWPVESPEIVEPLNTKVEAIYGRPLQPPEASSHAAAHIQLLNLQIKFANVSQTWCPEVSWPRLGEPGTEDIERRFREIVVRRLTTANRISREDHARILEEGSVAQWQKEWHEYCCRPGVTQCLGEVPKSPGSLGLFPVPPNGPTPD